MTLSDDAVRAFAEGLVAEVLPHAPRARFFLAGGAYKTLIHGRPPRDVDLWAPTPYDHAALVAALDERGERAERKPFGQTWRVGARVVEVPDRAEPPTLVERLGRFDIALSAVGVEFRPDGGREVLVHPLARASIDRREVLLLKPLVNWRHALGTLARVRRYAAELGFAVPQTEEQAVWAVFEAQDLEMQAGMIDRLRVAAAGDHGVEADARARMRAQE